jgi:putative phosphoribosyl transferase
MIDRPPIFTDRRDSGRQLAEALRRFAVQDPVVLGLPRGGVPVAFEVADELGAPLDVIFVRKIGAPGHPELGLGALVDGAEPQVVLNKDVVELVDPPEGYVDQEVRRELEEIARRRKLYLGDRAPVVVRERVALVVDDGVATGGTVRAALQGLKSAGASRRVLAVPIGPPDVMRALRDAADEIVCLARPEPFIAVGLWYHDFTQTTDAEVVALLARAERRTARRRTVEAGRRSGGAPPTQPGP